MGFNRFPFRENDDFGPPPPPFRIRRRRWDFQSLGGANRWIILGVSIILLYIILNTGKGIYVDWLWFDGAGYSSVYSKIITTRILLFIGGAMLFIAFFGANVFYAGHLALRNPAPGLAEAEAAALRRLYLLALIAGTLFFAVIFGTIAAGNWDVVLRFINRESFGVKDPQFGRDVGFYVFQLPALQAAQGLVAGPLDPDDDRRRGAVPLPVPGRRLRRRTAEPDEAAPDAAARGRGSAINSERERENKAFFFFYKKKKKKLPPPKKTITYCSCPRVHTCRQVQLIRRQSSRNSAAMTAVAGDSNLHETVTRN